MSSPIRAPQGVMTVLLIFGFRVYEDVLGVLRYVCETCGHEAAHQVLRRRRRFTLFFIPLFFVLVRSGLRGGLARMRGHSDGGAEGGHPGDGGPTPPAPMLPAPEPHPALPAPEGR